jgi:outer membrane lipoprotein-sorting protein
MMRKLLVVSSLILVLSLAVAGCGQKMTAEEIVAKMQETASKTTDAHAEIQVNLNVEGMDLSATAEVWEKSPNKIYAHVSNSSQPEYEGVTLVSDGQQAWLYDPVKNQVTVGAAGEIDLPLPQEMIASMQGAIQQVLDASDVELAGEEAVAGHDTYKLTLSQKEGNETELFPGNGTATLWVDKERWIVLKAIYEAGALGQGTMEVLDYELNPGLTDDRFHLEIPEGAQIIEAHAEEAEPLTLEEAKAQAGFPLLVPDYAPGGATLIEVFKMSDMIILRYDHSPDVAFAIMQGQQLAGLPSFGQAETVTVRGQEATVITEEASGNTVLYWTENDVTVGVAGHISLDEAIKVAESLK